jgi:hypothetical protein
MPFYQVSISTIEDYNKQVLPHQEAIVLALLEWKFIYYGANSITVDCSGVDKSVLT